MVGDACVEVAAAARRRRDFCFFMVFQCVACGYACWYCSQRDEWDRREEIT
jgi:hypothetical protein